MARWTARVNEAARKLDALTRAGVDTPPACEGDDAFIADKGTLLPPELSRMRLVCSRCPLFDPCGDYAAPHDPKPITGPVWPTDAPRRRQRRQLDPRWSEAGPTLTPS